MAATARRRRRTADTGARPRARCAHRLTSCAPVAYAHSCAFALFSGYPPAYGGYGAPPPYGAPPAYGGGYGAPPGYGGGAPVCHDYQNGRCFRATCKFSHEGPVRAAPGGGGGYGGGREVCHDFQNGRCFRGDSCRFAHSMDGAPPNAMMPSSMPGDWICACGFNNFARNSNCNKCSAPRADGGQAAPYGDTYHASANAAAAVADSMPSAPANCCAQACHTLTRAFPPAPQTAAAAAAAAAAAVVAAAAAAAAATAATVPPARALRASPRAAASPRLVTTSEGSACGEA